MFCQRYVMANLLTELRPTVAIWSLLRIHGSRQFFRFDSRRVPYFTPKSIFTYFVSTSPPSPVRNYLSSDYHYNSAP